MNKKNPPSEGLMCPEHKVLFEAIERSIEGRRICPYGDVWRAKGESLVKVS